MGRGQQLFHTFHRHLLRGGLSSVALQPLASTSAERLLFPANRTVASSPRSFLFTQPTRVQYRAMSSTAPGDDAAGNDAIKDVRRQKRALRKQMGSNLSKLEAHQVVEQSRQITDLVLQSSDWKEAHSISIYVSMQSGEVLTDQLCSAALAEGKRLYVPLFAAPSFKETSTYAPDSVPSTPAAEERSNPTSEILSASANFANDMRMLRIRTQDEFDAMQANRWGIREPQEFYADISEGNKSAGAAPQAREDALLQATGGTGLDLILAPGVVFDWEGGRLGHGKGYYDRYISKATSFNRERGKEAPMIIALALDAQIMPKGETVPRDENDLPMTAIVHSKGWIHPVKAG